MAAKGIIVGCATYISAGIPDLKYAEDDAAALHERLVDPNVGGFEPAETHLLLAPIQVSVSIHLEQLLQGAGPADSVLVYFAGHGLRDDRGQMYLAVADTHPDILRSTSISARYIRELLNDCRSRQICVILDCCFSGAFGQGHRSVLNSGDVKAALGTLEAEGTIVLTSSQAAQQSRESEKYSHGTFTHYLLEGLDGAADTDADGLITPVELYEFISQRMERDVGKAQRPMLIGSLAGGSFSIARSKSRRDIAIATLEVEVTELVERRQHATALERLQAFVPSSAREQQFVHDRREQLRADMLRLTNEFRRQLFTEGGDGVLSISVLHQAEGILARRPNCIFEAGSKERTDNRELILRNHFIGRIDASAMNDLWPKTKSTAPGTTDSTIGVASSSPPAPPPQITTSAAVPAGAEPPQHLSQAPRPDTLAKATVRWKERWPRLARASQGRAFLLGLWTVTLLSAALWIYTTRVTAGFDPQALKLGLLLRSSWEEAEATTFFGSVLDELGGGMRGHYTFARKISTYATLKEVVQALRTGQIDIAGELAPWDIYEANRLARALPFVSAKYDGNDTYASLLIARRERAIWNGARIDQLATWDMILNALDAGEKLAVSREPSTSGYWYPRFMVLQGFARLRKQARAFDDVVERLDSDDIPQRVACGAGKVVAGTIANFRFRDAEHQQCSGRDVTLVQVRASDPIKHGAFVVRQSLAEDQTLMERLKGEWQNAVCATAERLAAPAAATTATVQRINPDCGLDNVPGNLSLPTTWQRVDLNYYENMRPVFTQPDPVLQQRLRVLIAACALLVLAACAYLWLATRRTTAENVA